MTKKQTIKGKYSEAVVYTDNIESEATAQIFDILGTKMVEGEKVRVMPDCLTIDTEVLTERGFIKIVDLLPTDKIGNYDSYTKLIEFNYPKSIINRPLRDDELIYKYVNKRGYEFKVTENHRMAIKNNLGEVAKNIDSFYTKDYIFNARGVKNPIKKYTDNDIRLLCWIVGDGNIHITHNKKSDCKRVRFGLKKIRKIERLKYLLDEENIRYHSYVDKRNITNITIATDDSKKFINWIDETKKIPEDLILISHEQAEIFLEELIQVDGDYEAYKSGKGYRINSKNKKILNIISSILSINFGLTKTITRIMNSSYIPSAEISYINLVSEASLTKSKGGIHHSRFIREELPTYSDNVVCVETDTGYFIARQNGLTFITGNCHSGKGCVIGYTQTYTGGPIDPDTIGVDICCGVLSVGYEISHSLIGNPELLNARIRKTIPLGQEINEKSVVQEKEFRQFLKKRLEKARSLWPEMIKYEGLGEIDKLVTRTCARLGMDLGMFWKSLGTLGGGNHFIEVGKKEGAEIVYLTIHTGSRNLGTKILSYWKRQIGTDRILKSEMKKAEKEIKDRYKGDGRTIKAEIEKLHKSRKHVIPASRFLEQQADLQGYLEDMFFAGAWAEYSRSLIASRIAKVAGFGKEVDRIESVHNYIDLTDRVIRKGAISAREGERVIIPMNMSWGVIIGEGLGNPEWNYSAPHGAGRKLSRRKAKDELGMEEFAESMEGVFSTSICQSCLDESPGAYKDPESVLTNIGETVNIIGRIKPLLSIKDGEV